MRRPFGDQESSYPPMPAFAPQVSSGVWDVQLPLSDRVAFENRVVHGDIHVERRGCNGNIGSLDPGWTANLRASLTARPARVLAYVHNLFDNDRPILLNAGRNAADPAGVRHHLGAAAAQRGVGSRPGSEAPPTPRTP